MNADDNNPRRRHEYELVGERCRIYQRGKTWWVNYADSDGKQVRHTLRTRSKKQARILALRREAELTAGRDASRIKIAKLDEAIARYDEFLITEGRAEKTLSKYRRVYRLAADLARVRRIQDLRGLDLAFIDAYRKMRKDAGKSVNTIHDETVIIRQLVNFALRRDLLDRDRFKGLRLKKPTRPPQPCWTPVQVEAILNAAKMDPYHSLFCILAWAGLRIGEAKHLTWEDVDLQQGVLHIRGKVVDAKSGARWTPKTGASRVVPLGPPARRLFTEVPHYSRWVFTAPPSVRHPGRDRRIDERRALAHLKKVLAAVGLPGHLHTFRHAFVSAALVSGVPEAVVREWAGHVDAKILRHYTHIADSESQAFMQHFAANGDSKTAPNAETRTSTKQGQLGGRGSSPS